MPSVFFKIGTTDLTDKVDVQTYAVNREDVFEEWTDANWTDHRVVARQRCRGSLRVGFSSLTDYDAFVALLTAQKAAGGYFTVTAYINNLGAAETFEAFLDASNPEDRWDLAHGRQWIVTEIAVTGR